MDKARLFIEADEDEFMGLYLQIENKVNKPLRYEYAFMRLDLYLEQIKSFINEASIYLNALPNLTLFVDDSVYLFRGDDIEDNEIEKHVNSLIREIVK